jgi:Ca2+-binding RTX toxin-like protein
MSVIFGTDAPDILVGSSGADVIFGYGASDIISGGDGNDTLIAGAGNDLVVGGPGDDVLISDDGLSGGGHDTLNGAGTDLLSGGDGNDTLVLVGPGSGIVDGGAGSDIFAVSGATSGVHYDTSNTGPQDIGGGLGVHTLLNVEVLNGTPFNDTITGNGHFGFLVGSPGNDILDGGAGSRAAVLYANSPDGVTVDLRIAGPQFISAFNGMDTIRNVEAVAGSQHDDRITGNDDGNLLKPNDGNDVVFGMGGDDTIIASAGDDTIDGGSGHDVVRFTGAVSDYKFDFQNGGTLVVTDLRPGSPDGTEVLNKVEAAQFGPLTYNDQNEILPAPEVPIGNLHALSAAQSHVDSGVPNAVDHLQDMLDKLTSKTALFSVDAFV